MMNFTTKKLTILNLDAQYISIESKGTDAVFYGANGFPIGTYSEFLKEINPAFNLNCLSPRACWPNIGDPERQTNWEIYADDLIAFIEQKYNEPITVIGHSQGSTAAIIAASKRPELFKSLLLIEPASVSTLLGLVVKFTPYFIKKNFQPFKSGLQKQEIWDSRENFYDYYRKHRAYKRFPDKVLKDYTKFGLKPLKHGHFTLTFSSKWETSNYALAPTLWKYLKKVKTPIHIIAGKPSLFFTDDVRKKWQKNLPYSSFKVNDKFGHLYPLEAPKECADDILNSMHHK